MCNDPKCPRFETGEGNEEPEPCAHMYAWKPSGKCIDCGVQTGAFRESAPNAPIPKCSYCGLRAPIGHQCTAFPAPTAPAEKDIPEPRCHDEGPQVGDARPLCTEPQGHAGLHRHSFTGQCWPNTLPTAILSSSDRRTLDRLEAAPVFTPEAHAFLTALARGFLSVYPSPPDGVTDKECWDTARAFLTSTGATP